MIKIIVVLCDSFQDAKDGYDICVSWFEENEPFALKATYDSCWCFETDDDYRFIFVYYKMKSIFDTFKCVDFISLEELLKVMNDNIL